MRKFTQLMLTLALLVVGVGVVKSQTLIKEVVFSEVASYSMWHADGVVPTITDNTLQYVNGAVTENEYDIQYEAANGIELVEGGNYKIRLFIKGSDNGSLICALGNWDNTRNDRVYFTTSEESVEIMLTNFPATIDDAHVLIQSGYFEGTTNISKVQVFDMNKIPYPALKTYDLSLDAAKWTSGWNASAANDGDNLVITLTNNYGGKGISLTETAATTLSSCNKICVVIESYAGGWGQLIAKSGGDDKAVTGIGTVEVGTPKTFTLEYDPADNIDEFDIQGGDPANPITISRVYLLETSVRMPGTKIYTYDYDGKSDFPWYHDGGWGTKPTVSDILTAENDEVKGNPSDYMFFVADGITTNENKEYYVRATIKGSVAGSIVCNLGNWDQSGENTLSLTTEYQDVDVLISGVPTATNNHVIFKIGKYVGTISLKKIEVYEALGAKIITVGSAGFTTFSSNYGFATSNTVTAYGAKYDGSKIVLTPVTEIPANAGVIIEAAEGTHKVPVIEGASSITSVNDLLVSDGSVTGNGTIYALGKKGDVVGFAKVKSGATVPAGKAYLVIPAASPSRDFFGFGEDEATGIENLTPAISEGEGTVYDLQGCRVAQPTKGLYIVNGKKVLVK